MDISHFNYKLPPERIAQQATEPREDARLLLVEKTSGNLHDLHIRDIPSLLTPKDLLVFNDSRVFNARLRTKRADKPVELLLLRPEEQEGIWTALAKPMRALHVNDTLTCENGSRMSVEEKRSDGTIMINFHLSHEDVFALADTIGELPLPPYVQSNATNRAQYQTVYATMTGSVAAPTAGLHFTTQLLNQLAKNGVQQTFVTLHVGIGTFRPMKTETLEEHTMHEEWVSVPEETMKRIDQTRERGGRVIAVGTTTVRALESLENGARAFSGNTRLFITPGYTFKYVDGLITNFHLPRSTLLVLVSAFAGREHIINAYEHAIANDYRFYSFGDAMIIL